MTFPRARGGRPALAACLPRRRAARRALARRPLPRAALARRAAAALAIAALAAPAAASAASAGMPGPFGLIPVPSPGGQQRSYFSLNLRPGGSAADTAIVVNQSRQTEHLTITASNGVTATNAGSAYEAVSGRCTGPACWISGLRPSVTLPPGGRRDLTFRVRVPRHTPPREYLAGLTAETRGRTIPLRGGRHTRTRAIVLDQVTVGVAVTVGMPAGLRTRLRIARVTGGWAGRMPRLFLTVANPGQTFARASGHVACVAAGRRHAYPVFVDTVLPGGRAVLPVNARGLVTGQVPCTVRLRDSAGHLVTWSGQVQIPSLVPVRTYHVAKGVYVSLPQRTVPPWAIALIVIGALAAALLVRGFVRARRRGATGILPRVPRGPGYPGGPV